MGWRKFTIDLHCDSCNQDGNATWESNPWHGNERLVLAKLSDGFYERITKKAPHRTEIVCASCGCTRLHKSEEAQFASGKPSHAA